MKSLNLDAYDERRVRDLISLSTRTSELAVQNDFYL
jgi:hypothetical protein